MHIRQEIINESRTWLKTPFKHQGRVKHKGVDCVGLIIGVAKDLGIFDCRIHNYPEYPDVNMMTMNMDNHLIPIKIKDMNIGDIFYLKFFNAPIHVGIKTDRGIIHAYKPYREVVEHKLNDKWISRIHAAYKYPGID